MDMRQQSEAITSTQPLEQAFHVFNEMSQNLVESYQQLEQKVERLSVELSQARSEKILHLTEKEALANRLGLLIDTLPGAVLVLDEHHVIIEANARAEQWLGKPLVGVSWTELMTLHFSEHFQQAGQHRLADGRLVAVSSQPVLEKESVILLTDITEQYELSLQLEHKKKLAEMGEFSASIAHQLRTPLASALLYASELSQGQADINQKQRYSDKILDRLGLLDALVTGMLTYSHKGDFEKREIVVSELIDSLMSQYQHSHVHLDVEIDVDCHVLVAKEALVSAIGNLLDNAIEASCGQTVVCAFSTKNHTLHIEVTDEGTGMDDEQLATIFEPFYTTKKSGTGLGLAVVQDVVKSHEGTVTCHSNIDLGTKFTIEMPVLIKPTLTGQEDE